MDSIYSGPVVIDTCTVIKARAFKTGMFPSPISERLFTIVVDTPVFSPTPPDTFYQAQDVSICCSTPEAVIHYTINGEEPAKLDSVYTNPIHIDTTVMFKARAFKYGCEPSAVAEATYVIDLSSPVADRSLENRITKFKLFENYPNPFNMSTYIHYQLPKESVIFLKLFDLLGREVITFENGITKETGSHSVLWDGRDANGSIVPSGIYILRIQAGNYIEQKKLVLTK